MRKIHLIFILDRSGSMSGLEEDTIGGYNGFLEKYQDIPNTTVTTVLFDQHFELLHDCVKIQDAKLTKESYQVRGITAMLDAIGHTVSYVNSKKPFTGEKDKTIYIVTTDGMENASRTYSYQNIHHLIRQEQELANEFVFLGANIDVSKEAMKLGIKKEFARNYQADKEGTKEMYHEMDCLVKNIMSK